MHGDGARMARCSFTILLAAGVFAAGTTLGSADDRALCRKADSDEALQACERALAADLVDKAEVATAYRSRGIQHYRAGDIERAKAAFADMLRHDPNNSAFYLGRAVTYLRNGQFEHAIVD